MGKSLGGWVIWPVVLLTNGGLRVMIWSYRKTTGQYPKPIEELINRDNLSVCEEGRIGTQPESYELRESAQNLQDRVEELEYLFRTAEADKKDALTRAAQESQKSQETERQLQQASWRVGELETLLKTTETEKQEALTRLSDIVSHQVRDHNPNIVDLSDVYRPEKLAELSNTIYDNQWLDAYDDLTDEGIEEGNCETILLDLLMKCYSFCSKLAEEHMDIVKTWFIPTSDDQSSMEIQNILNEGRKQKALDKLPDVEKECISHLKHEVKPFENQKMVDLPSVQTYLRACVKLCWLMAMQDPPVVMVCPGWESALSGDSASSNPQVDHTPVTAATCDEGPYGIMNGSSASKKDAGGQQSFNTDDIKVTIDDGDGNPNDQPTPLFNEYTGDERACQLTNGPSATQNIDNGHSRLQAGPNDEANININENRVILDKNFYKEYTEHGTYIKYMVWPCMLLHKGGLTLNKGVAQGYD